MEKVDMLFEPIRAVLTQIGVFLPRLALAVAVLAAGWLVAKIVTFAVVKGLRAINFNVLTERAGMDGFLQQGGIQSDTTDIFGALVYWLVIFATLVIACNSLGLTYATDLLGQVVLFLPKVIVALVILAFGAYFAAFVGGALVAYCRNVGAQDAELLGKLVQYAITVFIVLIALEQINVGGAIVRQSFLIILGGVVFALALAFGIGGQHWAAEMLERWWPRRRTGGE
jgi:flagellar biosynthesis protein FliQ